MDITINGKPLGGLRVVDLKVELEKRGLPKSGNKTDLIERLTQHLVRQTQSQNEGPVVDNPPDGEDMAAGVQPPGMSLSHGLADNDFVRDYLKMRETQFASALSDQDAHLATTRTQGSDIEMQTSFGQAKSDNTENQAFDSVQNQGPVDRHDNLNESLPMVPIHHKVPSANITSTQEANFTRRPKPAQDGTAQINEDAHVHKVDQSSKHLVSASQKEECDSKNADHFEKTTPSFSEERKQEFVPEPLKTNDTEVKKDPEVITPAISGSPETYTSDFCKEKQELKLHKPEDTRDETKESFIEADAVVKCNENNRSIPENAETPECDEIVVSNSPILQDFEEPVDEEKDIKSNTKNDSPPPPPDTTFRKLSRPVSNDASADDQKKKKRHWGKKENKDTDKDESTNTDILSGELLKDIVPDVKPYLEDLSKEDELDHEQETEEEEINGEEQEIKQPIFEEPSKENSESLPAKSPARQPLESSSLALGKVSKAKKGSISQLNPERSCVIEVRNLVRPFTLIQFKELLLRTGKINNIENGGFWIDKIKSHAIIEYLSPDEADETVMALDDVKWPSTNPKKLNVTFSTKDVLEKAINDNDVPQKSTLSREYNRRVNSKDEIEDPSHKRKLSETPSDTLSGNYFEASLLSKRVRNDSEKEAMAEGDKSASPKPKKHLDDLFRKTKALPSIYWMPKQQREAKS